MNKINKIIFSILSIIFLSACSDNSDKMRNLITKDSIQYWNYNMISKKQNIWFTFSFDKNGNVKKYSFYKNKRWLFEDYPSKPNLKWSISNDSIFNFLDTTKKIITISDDTISSIDLKTREKYMYYRVKGDLNIQPN